MIIDVVSVWAPRPRHPKWSNDYINLLRLHCLSAKKFGHRSVVVSDAKNDPGVAGWQGKFVRADLPASLMHAILAGQIAAVEQWDDARDIVLADIDCLVNRDLSAAFDGTFDVLLTRRDDLKAPIQNGAMYFARGSKSVALQFLKRAYDLCGSHWGGDQEALAAAVAPVPSTYCIEERFGARFNFASCDPYNHSSKVSKPRKTYIEHFKGDTKSLMHSHAHFVLGIN